MARQYKALQEDLIYKINSLETTLTEQKEELDMTNHELRELIRDKDDEIAHKDNTISELKSRMDDMSAEFADMLNTTLKLMRESMAAKLAGDAITTTTRLTMLNDCKSTASRPTVLFLPLPRRTSPQPPVQMMARSIGESYVGVRAVACLSASVFVAAVFSAPASVTLGTSLCLTPSSQPIVGMLGIF